MSERCAECRFFEVTRRDPTNGDCRRFPPVPFWHVDTIRSRIAGYPDQRFPTVKRTDWCGEFKEGKTP